MSSTSSSSAPIADQKRRRSARLIATVTCPHCGITKDQCTASLNLIGALCVIKHLPCGDPCWLAREIGSYIVVNPAWSTCKTCTSFGCPSCISLRQCEHCKREVLCSRCVSVSTICGSCVSSDDDNEQGQCPNCGGYHDEYE